MRERIEIFPGHWIEVTPKLKRQAGLRPSARVVATLMGETIDAATDVARESRKNVKYSRLMLDEAVRIAERDGMKKAEEVTGISIPSIDLRKRQIRRKKGLPKRATVGTRYTLAQKQACVKLAQQLMASKATVTRTVSMMGIARPFKRLRWGHRAAFMEAGRRLGLNGRSIEWMWIQGMIPLDQQPSGA